MVVVELNLFRTVGKPAWDCMIGRVRATGTNNVYNLFFQGWETKFIERGIQGGAFLPETRRRQPFEDKLNSVPGNVARHSVVSQTTWAIQ